MSRKKKIIALQAGDMRTSVRERREYEESLLNSDGSDLDDISSVDFVNETARKEYRRVLGRLREELGVVGNLNKGDLVNYANAFGRYMDLVKECRKRDFSYLIETPQGPKANPLIRMMDEAQRSMGASASRLGMTIDGMLKAAKAKADREEAEMEQMFGAI